MERSIFDALRVTPEDGGATATLVGALDERGALAWRESPEDEAAAHLARKKWIVAMLRDGARNEAYAAAIAGAAEAVAARFGGGAVALEIGAGTGLLTLMLCDQALGHLVDHGLLGEGMLPSLRECFDSGTVRRDAVCVPRAATVYAALVACPRARRAARAPERDGRRRVAPRRRLRRRPRGGARAPRDARGVRAAHALGALRDHRPGGGDDPRARAPPRAGRRGRRRGGAADAVVFYWSLDLGFGLTTSNDPDGPYQDHWLQMAMPLPARVDVRAGDEIALTAIHDDEAVVFDVSIRGAPAADAAALCSCGWHVWCSHGRLAALAAFDAAPPRRASAGDARPRVDVGDSAPVALAAAAADGCPHTAVLCDDRDALLASRVDARVRSRSLDGVSRRVVVSEPFYHALEGHPLATALRFWRRANALDAAAVEPRGATVVLEALRSDELRAAYGPLPDSILDLPHGAAAAAWREAAATLVPLDLADYAYEVASETVLCAFDFERPFEDVAARVAVPDCGPVDAFALAVRFHGRGADARRLARFHVGEPGATDVLFELRGDGSCALDVVARKKRPREE
ncbi:hypothetical protein JL722_7815 [Aureococcus anophagefferens]|nr:hypothetical protein JL722_7815 [Aureococcus anophagefferens]